MSFGVVGEVTQARNLKHSDMLRLAIMDSVFFVSGGRISIVHWAMFIVALAFSVSSHAHVVKICLIN